jgi:hypothetical protein
MNEKQKRPRCVIVFDSDEDFEDVRNYAKSKGLDMKNFFMWLAKSHMLKYPLKAGRAQEGV